MILLEFLSVRCDHRVRLVSVLLGPLLVKNVTAPSALLANAIIVILDCLTIIIIVIVVLVVVVIVVDDEVRVVLSANSTAHVLVVARARVHRHTCQRRSSHRRSCHMYAAAVIVHTATHVSSQAARNTVTRT